MPSSEAVEDVLRPASRSRSRLLEVLERPQLIVPHFQPIVDLARGSVAGFELLSRFDLPGGERPAEWFEAAARHGLVAELDATLVELAIRRLPTLPPNCFLTVNVTSDGACSAPVRDAIKNAGSIGGLVIELTEQTGGAAEADLAGFARHVREHGGLIAVDDVGTGYSSLQRVMAIRPEFVKIDRSFVSALHADEAKVAAVEMVGGLAGRIDAWVVAEGVERVPELERLRGLSVPLAQGFLFSRPAPEPHGTLDGGQFQWPTENPAERCEIDSLVEEIEPLRPQHDAEELRQRFEVDPDLEYLPLVDRRERPEAVVGRPRDRESPAVRKAPLSVHPGASLRQVARRAITREAGSRFFPLVYCTELGRYRGLVRIERVIEALTGDGHAPDALRSP